MGGIVMQPIYNSYVTEEMARQLLSLKFPLHKYSVGDYNGKPSFFTVSGTDTMWADSDRFKIPTYAEVMDMLYDKGYIISIEPIDLEGNLRFQFKVYQINTDGTNVLIVSGITGSANSTLRETMHIAIDQILDILDE